MLKDLFYIEVDSTYPVRTEQFLFSDIKVTFKYIFGSSFSKNLPCDVATLFRLCKMKVKIILVKSVFITKPTIECM